MINIDLFYHEYYFNWIQTCNRGPGLHGPKKRSGPVRTQTSEIFRKAVQGGPRTKKILKTGGPWIAGRGIISVIARKSKKRHNFALD